MTEAHALPQLDASSLVDGERLEEEVKAMYRHVAREDDAELHFEVGREVTEHLGYPAELLDAIPAEALASFAGVGYHLDLAALRPGESVLDLGSGSGTDVFCAAVQVGESGRVVGVDMTDEQLAKAARLRDQAGFSQVELVESHIEELPFEDASFDVVACRVAAHHFEDVERAVAEMARVSTSLVLVADNLRLADAVEEAERLRDPTHVRCYSEDEWQTLFAAAGLAVEDVRVFDKRIELQGWLARAGCDGEPARRVRELLGDRVEDGHVILSRGVFKGRKA
jgi:arsenite methyltransferase